MIQLTGAAELVKTLNGLGDDKAVKRAARSGVTKGLRVLAKSIKAQIPPKYKDAKRGIGQSFKKNKRAGVIEAKVGVGVGISKKRQAKFKKKDRGKRPGVGAGPQNLHWFILGTDERQTGSRTRRNRNGDVTRKPTGNAVHSTGQMHPQPEVEHIIRAGMSAGDSEAMAAITQGVKDGIAREVAKAKK